MSNYVGATVNSWNFCNTGAKITGSSSVAYGTAYTSGDRIGVYVDVDNHKLHFFKNGTDLGLAYTLPTRTGVCYIPAISLYGPSGVTLQTDVYLPDVKI